MTREDETWEEYSKPKEDKETSNMENKTSRGFKCHSFEDANGMKCSIQESSATTLEEDNSPGSSFLWLGIDDCQPKIMATKAKEHGIETEETTGWVQFPIPKDVLLSTRMHLARSQVMDLILQLEYWLNQ